MSIDESNIEPVSYKEAIKMIRDDLSVSDNARYAKWWSGMSYLERVSIVGCSMVFTNVSTNRPGIRKIACSDWVDICVTSQIKLVGAVKRISSRAKSYGVYYV